MLKRVLAKWGQRRNPYKMKMGARKLTRFYVINPITDRRMEKRFESRESVVVRFPLSGKVVSATAYDIGKRGLRLELDVLPQPGMDIELVFPNTSDRMQCFGRVVWVKSEKINDFFECGVSIEVWHGVIKGENSWTSKRGTRQKPERRQKLR